jgi:hypothetical protein
MSNGFWMSGACPDGEYMEHGGRTKISLATSCRLKQTSESDETTPSLFVRTKNLPALHILLFRSHIHKSTVGLH